MCPISLFDGDHEYLTYCQVNNVVELFGPAHVQRLDAGYFPRPIKGMVD